MNPKQFRRTTRRPRGAPGASRTPTTTLSRTFRYAFNRQINNTSGSGVDIFGYYSKAIQPRADSAIGFRDAQQTFELWRMKRVRVKAMPGYNNYNQTYNTINADAASAMQIWTAADLSNAETVSGETIMSYNNAVCNTLSINNLKTICDYKPRLNAKGTPSVILTQDTWLDTAADMDTAELAYSQFQLYVKMPGLVATNYLPIIQFVVELDVEFKQPAYQNRPSYFEAAFVGATLEVIPAANEPAVRRTYVVERYTMQSPDNEIHLKREDGETGSLTYTQDEFFTLWVSQTSGKYFGDRSVIYNGPTPRRPINWVAPVE